MKLAVRSREFVEVEVEGKIRGGATSPCQVLIDTCPKVSDVRIQSLWMIKAIWDYARASGLVTVDECTSPHEQLPKGLGDLVLDIRARCDRCGMPRKRINVEGIVARTNLPSCLPLQKRVEIAERLEEALVKHSLGGIELDLYQCCRVETDEESYVPDLCVDCHRKLQEIRPHSTISV